MTNEQRSYGPVSVVVPARNEAQTIGRVIAAMLPMPDVGEVIVVDNGSKDETAEVAAKAGARVLYEPRAGMGHAIRTGFLDAENNWVMKVDADLDNFDLSLFARMIEARAPGIGLVKGAWQNPKDNMPMTRLLVMPALAQMFPGLRKLTAPNTGLYAFDRSLIALQELVGDYAADLDVMLRIHAAGAEVIEVDIGRILNNPRDISHYNAMAETIMGFFLQKHSERITDVYVAVADRAGAVISGCLGSLAAHARAGGMVRVYLGVLDDPAADALRDALAPFPTARVLGSGGMAEYHPAAATSHLRIFATCPEDGNDRVWQAAQRLAAQVGPAAGPEILGMPGVSMPESWRPDISLPAGTGAGIKHAALARIGIGDAPALHELFQSEAGVTRL